MNPHQTALIALTIALLGQLAATRLLLERFFRKPPDAGRGKWLTLAGGTLLLALQHAYALEFLLDTGIYDFRQAILSALAGLLLAFGCFRVCRSPS